MTIIFVLVVSLSLYIANKKMNTSESEINNIKDSLIYLSIFAASLTIDLVTSKLDINIPFIVYLAVMIAEIITCIVLNAKRENEIKKKHDLIKQVIRCLAPVRKNSKIDEDIDKHLEDEDLGFQLKYDTNGELDGIECEMEDPTRWTDDIITKIVFNLNKFIPTKQWVSHPDHPKLLCKFEGTKLPPKIAKYPGSFLRPNNYIPLGVNGVGELGWNLGAKSKEIGDSLFVYEDGTSAKTIIPAKAPQALVGGSTGGGKAIYLEQEVEIKSRENSGSNNSNDNI